MKHFNILLITLKIDAIKQATTEKGNQYAIINGIFEKEIKDIIAQKIVDFYKSENI